MQLFNKRLPQGQGLARVLLARLPHVSLTWDTRQKSRFDATDTNGQAVGIFLQRGTVLRGGDVLVGTGGELLGVQSAMQTVLRITSCTAHGTPFDLVRAAYHLGNRHVPIELTPTYLHIEPDHVLAEMLRAMHLIVDTVEAAFEPEAGAYSSDGGHTHHHGDAAHSHSHASAHDHH